MTKCSIVIPLYNINEEYFRECLEGCLNQDFDQEYEIILVSDGSPTSLQEKLIIQEINDPRIRYEIRPHGGIANTRKYAMTLVRGEYAILMDQDDYMLPNRLQVQCDYLDQHPEYSVLGCGIYRKRDNIFSNGHYTNSVLEKSPIFNDEENGIHAFNNEIRTTDDMIVTDDNGNYQGLCSYIYNSNCAIRMSDYNKLPISYQPMYDGVDDFKLIYNFVYYGFVIKNIPIITGIYRIHINQTTKVRGDEMLSDILTFNRVRFLKKYNEDTAKLTIIVISTKNDDYNELFRTIENIRMKSSNVIICLGTNYENNIIQQICDYFYVNVFAFNEKTRIPEMQYECVRRAQTDNVCIINNASYRFVTQNFEHQINDFLDNNPSFVGSPTEYEFYYDKYGCCFNEKGDFVNTQQNNYLDGTYLKHSSQYIKTVSNVKSIQLPSNNCFFIRKQNYVNIPLYELLDINNESKFIGIINTVTNRHIDSVMRLNDLIGGHLQYRIQNNQHDDVLLTQLLNNIDDECKILMAESYYKSLDINKYIENF